MSQQDGPPIEVIRQAVKDAQEAEDQDTDFQDEVPRPNSYHREQSWANPPVLQPASDFSAQLVRPATVDEVASITKAKPDRDFIRNYVRYADVLEAPSMAHEWVAVQLLASILNRNGVWIELGNSRIPFDLWIVLFSGSGFGRSTLIEMPKPVLEQASLKEIIRSTRWGSPQAMFQEMAKQPHGLYVWGEMSERLKLLKSPQFAGYGAMPWLTDRYDSWAVPEAVNYRQTGKPNQDRPPISFSVAPRTNIFATSSEEWLFGSLAQEDSAGGFLPRWILVRLPDSGKVVPIPPQVDSDREFLLANVLEMLDKATRNVKEPADLTNVRRAYERWYGDTKHKFEAQPNRALATAYFNRHRSHVVKLAVIYEVSANTSLQVSQASWERAVGTAKQLEGTIFELLPTGMSTKGYSMSRMERKVRDGGSDGVQKTEFTRTFQDLDLFEQHKRLATLIEAGRVTLFRRETPGRPALCLVHADYLAEYRENHPEDTAGSLR